MFALTVRDVEPFIDRVEVRAKMTAVMQGDLPALAAAETDDRAFAGFDADA